MTAPELMEHFCEWCKCCLKAIKLCQVAKVNLANRVYDIDYERGVASVTATVDLYLGCKCVSISFRSWLFCGLVIVPYLSNRSGDGATSHFKRSSVLIPRSRAISIFRSTILISLTVFFCFSLLVFIVLKFMRLITSLNLDVFLMKRFIQNFSYLSCPLLMTSRTSLLILSSVITYFVTKFCRVCAVCGVSGDPFSSTNFSIDWT